MKQAFVLAIASFGLATAAFAQAPTTNPSPGPHDPNPALNVPDLRLPPPCAPTPTLAANDEWARPAMTMPETASAHATPIESEDTIFCSANTLTQSAELPGLIPAAGQ